MGSGLRSGRFCDVLVRLAERHSDVVPGADGLSSSLRRREPPLRHRREDGIVQRAAVLGLAQQADPRRIAGLRHQHAHDDDVVERRPFRSAGTCGAMRFATLGATSTSFGSKSRPLRDATGTACGVDGLGWVITSTGGRATRRWAGVVAFGGSGRADGTAGSAKRLAGASSAVCVSGAVRAGFTRPTSTSR